MRSSVEDLRRLASKICSKHGTLCFGEADPDDLVLFGFTWVESFYYLDPAECAQDLKCIETVFEMHLTVFNLAREGLYVVNNDEELIESTVKKLLELSKAIDLSKIALSTPSNVAISSV